MQQHAQPQVPDAGHRRVAGAVRARLRRRPLLPPPRPRHDARGDGVGDERHRLGRQGAVLGHAASGRPTRSAAPSRSPSATTCTSRSPSSRSTTCSSARRVEQEYARLFAETGYGATIWSPLASGLLTGKYRDGIPDDSRGALAGYGWLAERLTDERALAKVERLRPIADELGCSMAQLAAGLVHDEPQRVDRDHRRQPAEPGRRELRRPRRHPQLDADVLARIDAAVK